MKSRGMRWAWHVVRTDIRGMNRGFYWEIQKEGDNKEDLDVSGRMILKCILEKYDGVL
jgi:hypothetical protein